MSTTAAVQDQSSNKSPNDTQFKLMTGHHRGRIAQVPIYLGKNFRMFIYQTDWKVLPMSALIAALIAFVVGENMFVTMEGQFQCSLALTCVCIWNGFFNSIQSVCRERPIIKREHRAGMHISSYVTAHLIYQMFLCAAQALITVSVCKTVGIKFPTEGFITPWFLADIWITSMEAYRNYDEFSKCSRCKLKQFCRGCPAVAKGYTGDFYGDDPQCWASEENGLLTPKEERRAG